MVLPQPGSNNAHRVDKNLKKELFDKAQLIDDVPFAKEIFQVSIDDICVRFVNFKNIDFCAAWREQPAVQPDSAPCNPAQEVSQPRLEQAAEQVSYPGPNKLSSPSPPHGLHPRPLHLRAAPAQLKVSLLTTSETADNNGEELEANESNKQQEAEPVTGRNKDGGGQRWLATKKATRSEATAAFQWDAKDFYQIEPQKPSRIYILTSTTPVFSFRKVIKMPKSVVGARSGSKGEFKILPLISSHFVEWRLCYSSHELIYLLMFLNLNPENKEVIINLWSIYKRICTIFIIQQRSGNCMWKIQIENKLFWITIQVGLDFKGVLAVFAEACCIAGLFQALNICSIS